MNISEGYINIFFVDNDKQKVRWLRVVIKPRLYSQGPVKKQIKKDVRSEIEKEYKDSLTSPEPGRYNAFGWLKEPLKILERISELKRIDEL